MRLLVLLPLLLPLTASARDMAPLNNPELATVIGLFQELVTTPSNSDHPQSTPVMLPSSLYRVVHHTPTIEAYRHLRQASGLSPKALEAAERGLPNSLFSVQVLCDGEPVAMGRVIGDGGCFYQVVDIAVLPAHQGRGLGKTVMGEIASYIEREVPASAYVSLIADGAAYKLYQQFGFALTAPASVGMAFKRKTSRASAASDVLKS